MLNWFRKKSILMNKSIKQDKIKQLGTRPEEWVDLYGDFLYRFAIGRLHNTNEAENAVQETFLAALTSRKRFIGNSTERTWLISILKHKIIDQFRKNYRERPVTDLTDVEEEINSFFDQIGHPTKPPSQWQFDPRQLLENKEFWQTFRDCLQKLPRAIRDAFQLREVEKLTSPEVCQILNIKPSNLWVMLYRARLQLRHCLEINWYENGPHAD
jgi:RNA polymerase sigma-70 factor, ECF subfamily